MPNQEKIQGIPSTNLIIQKSFPLLSLWRSNLTLAELKILDMYLARINSRDPHRRTVCFEKGDLERVLGVTEIKGPILKQRLRNLCIAVEIADPSRPEGFLTISLFESMQGGLDENGQWKVELQCTEAAKKYIFNIDNIGYIRYRLQEIVNLRSRYSYILFLYLEQNRFRGTWEISLNDLKKILKCDHINLYNDFRRFNEKVLKHAQRELKERNNYIFTYDLIRQGRRVVALKFAIQTPPLNFFLLETTSPETLMRSYVEASKESNEGFTPSQEFLLAPCDQPNGPAFSETQKRQILQELQEIPVSALPSLTGFGQADSISIPFQLQHLISKCYEKLRIQLGKREIHDPFSYFMQILKNSYTV